MSITSLNQWLATPRGQYLLAWERRQLDHAVADIFGFNAAQIGLCEQDFLRANRMPFRIRCSACTEAAEPGSSIHLCAEELPFASQSLDLVVLPHVLEFSTHSHQVLREAERVLVPEGHLVIAGFNPFSLWGLRRALSGNLGEVPWTGQYISALRLRDWLSLLGFESRMVAFGCYAPPVASDAWLHRLSFLDSVGGRCWPVAGAAYVVHAVKRVQGMRLIQPRWREARLRRKGKTMIPVVQRSDRQQ